MLLKSSRINSRGGGSSDNATEFFLMPLVFNRYLGVNS